VKILKQFVATAESRGANPDSVLLRMQQLKKAFRSKSVNDEGFETKRVMFKTWLSSVMKSTATLALFDIEHLLGKLNILEIIIIKRELFMMKWTWMSVMLFFFCPRGFVIVFCSLSLRLQHYRCHVMLSYHSTKASQPSCTS
jgi:hypothetical protein